MSGDRTPLWTRQRILRGAVLNAAGVLVNLFIGILLTPLLLRHLGAEGFGLLAVLLAVTGYVQLLEGGVGTSTVRRLAVALSRDDELYARRVVTGGFILNAGGSAIALVAILATLPFASSVVGASPDRRSEVQVAYAMVGVSQGFVLLATSWTARILASGRADLLARRGMLIALLSASAQGVVVLAGGGLTAVVGVTAASAVVSASVSVPLGRRVLPGYRVARADVHAATVRALFSDGLKQTAVAFAGAFSTGLDPILITLVLGPAAVAPYAVASRGVGFLRAVATRAADTLVAPFAGLHGTEDRARQYTLFRAATLGSGVLAIAGALPVAVFGEGLLRIWLGSYPARSLQVLAALCAVLVVQIPGHVAYVVLTARGDYRQLLHVGRVAVPVNVVLSTALTFGFGPVGPALGTLIVVLVADAWMLPARVCRSLDRRPRELRHEFMIVCIVPLLLVGLGAELLAHVLKDVDEWIGLVGAALTGATYLGVAAVCAGSGRRSEVRGMLRGTRTE